MSSTSYERTCHNLSGYRCNATLIFKEGKFLLAKTDY